MDSYQTNNHYTKDMYLKFLDSKMVMLYAFQFPNKNYLHKEILTL